MIRLSLTALRFAPLTALPMLLTPASAIATDKKQPPVAGRSLSPVMATTDIIPLPLNPILPTGQRLCGSNTTSGLGYTMLRPANGSTPAETDYVLVNYIGYLAASGVVFDQAIRAAFPVSGVIPGFSEGLKMIAKGAVARFCVPAAMGYGSESSGVIPANSDLVFQVELIDYKSAAEVEAMRGPGMDHEDSMPDGSASAQ